MVSWGLNRIRFTRGVVGVLTELELMAIVTRHVHSISSAMLCINVKSVYNKVNKI